MSTVTATLSDGRTVQFLPNPINEGAIKKVYFTADRKSVVCFYEDARTAADPQRMARLDAVLNRWNPTTNSTSGSYYATLFCWPTGIVVAPNFGLMVPLIPSNFFFGSGKWKGTEKESKWFTNRKLRKLLPPEERGNWLNHLQVSIQLSRAVGRLHMAGLALSGLSDHDVLIDPPSGKCLIMGIEDLLFVPDHFLPTVLFGTPGFVAPEVIASEHLAINDPNRTLPSTRTNLYALSVLIYEYLLCRHPLRGPKVNSNVSAEEDERLSMGEKALFIENPHDTSNRPTKKSGGELLVTFEHLGPYLSKVICRAFVDGLHQPGARPTAGEWETALCRTADLLIQCGNASCEEKWFIYRDGQKPNCPFCGWELKTRIPVLIFHYAAWNGQYRAEGHCLVGWNQRPLHKWHVFTNVRPGEGVDKETQAYVLFYQNQWILVNKNLDSMLSPSGQPVPKGQACPLRDGDEILLSKEDKGRMISVKMIP